MTAEGVLVGAVLLIACGAFSEVVLGSFSHFFDWRWPKKRHPIGGTHVKVIGGRIFIIVGLMLLVGSVIGLTV